MPKIIFEKNEKSLIPEHLQGEATETDDGTFELDASGILKKNKELLGKNANLTSRTEEAEAAAEEAKAQVKELKDKAKTPEGKTLVDSDVAELGEAAKTAGLNKGEIPTLKGKADELQGELDKVGHEKTISTVAEDHGLNEKFITLAMEKGLKFESHKEKSDDDKEVTVWDIVTEKDGKTEKQPIGDFLEKDTFFSKFADTFSDGDESQSGSDTGRKWVKQSSGKDDKPAPAAQKTINTRYGGTVAALTKDSDA